MPSAGERLLTNAAAYLTAAFPRHTAKHLERELQCSPSQAERIAKTGRIPEALKAAALRLLDSAIARNRAELERLHEEIRALDYQAMLARAEERRATGMGANAGNAARLAEGAEQLPLTALNSFRKDGQ